MDAERRRFLKAAGATAFLAACGDSRILRIEPQIVPENKNRSPERGDIIVDGEIEYLLRPKVAMGTPEKYWINSKGDEYGRRKHRDLPDLVRGDIFDRFPRRAYAEPDKYFGQFMAQLRVPKINGGEFGVCWAGGGTKGDFFDKDNNPFFIILEYLKSLGWQDQDFEFFTYGVLPFKSYSRSATLQHPDKIIRDAISFEQVITDADIYAQQNHIAHSAGGLYAFQAVMRNMNVVNNLILIGVPIRGLHGGLTGPVREVMEKMGLRDTDNLITYLLSIAGDKSYQADIDKKARDFTGKGRKITIIIHENDPIATLENAYLPGAEIIILRDEVATPWDAHGAGLFLPKSHQEIGKKKGRNLALAV